MSKKSGQATFINRLCLLSGSIGFGLLVAKDAVVARFSISSEVTLFLAVTFMLNAIAILLLNYLKTGKVLATPARSQSGEPPPEIDPGLIIESLVTEPSATKSQTKTASAEGVNLSHNELESKIIDRIAHHLPNLLAKKYAPEAQKVQHLQQLRHKYQQISIRLNDEIESLGRKSNLNLVIGVLTTITAVVLLSTTIMEGQQQLSNTELMAYYLPRLTLSIFIELFSFFFLRLYKAGLSEVKYMQNELTTIELRYIATEKALMSGNEETIAQVITELSTTERNFKLAPGESTVELEKQKSVNNSEQKILESITGLLKNNNSQ